MNRAKSTRRVRLLLRIGSPTWRLHTGSPWLSPSSRSLPRTTVHRVSLANTRRQASTWSSRSANRASRASGPNTFTIIFSLRGVHIPPVAGDVPSAREDETGPCRRVVEHGLGGARRVPMHTSRHEYDEHSVAPLHGVRDNLAIVRCPRNDCDPPRECGELSDALLATHANHLVTAIERVLHHVPPELPGGSDYAHLHRERPIPYPDEAEVLTPSESPETAWSSGTKAAEGARTLDLLHGKQTL